MKKQNKHNGNNRKLELRLLANTPFQGTGALSTMESQPARGKKRSGRRPHLEKIGGMDAQVRDFLSSFVQLNDPGVAMLRTSAIDTVAQLSEGQKAIVNLKRFNEVKSINLFLHTVNTQLQHHGLFACSVETKYIRKQRMLRKYPIGLNYGMLIADYALNRVMPKFPLLNHVHRFFSGQRTSAMSQTEMLGRICAAGFEIVEKKFIGKLLYIVARKVKAPLFDYEPLYGPVFRMPRYGKNGKVIHVYKMRTMHAYSEFIQQYVYEQNKLAEGGKMKDDFRISAIGKFARKYWIDELPMIWNLLNGELKLVGVRPLSAQYLSLYSQELKEKRSKQKPGLVPPFYADLPKTIQEIQDSEMKYLLAHERHPFLTDVKYFFKAAYNILFRHARSK